MNHIIAFDKAMTYANGKEGIQACLRRTNGQLDVPINPRDLKYTNGQQISNKQHLIGHFVDLKILRKQDKRESNSINAVKYMQ